MALMFMCADDAGVNRDVIGNQGISHNAFFESEVFGRITGIKCRERRFKFLSITAGMNLIVDQVMWKNG